MNLSINYQRLAAMDPIKVGATDKNAMKSVYISAVKSLTNKPKKRCF